MIKTTVPTLEPTAVSAELLLASPLRKIQKTSNVKDKHTDVYFIQA